MTYQYKVSGMTCEACAKKIKSLLSAVPNVVDVQVDLTKAEVVIDMDKHIPTPALQNALKDFPKYKLEDEQDQMMDDQSPEKSWIQTYKPILMVFGYLFGVTILLEITEGSIAWMRWMNHFMAGFFLVFSFFKFLDLKNFAETYSSYDIIAKRWMAWGYIYPFAELLLGIAYLVHFNPLATNSLNFAVMSISLVGVLKSVLAKRKIRCACLGAVFNLPMSAVTVTEDALMVVMSAIGLITTLA